MKLLKDNGTELTEEFELLMSVVCQLAWATQIGAYMVSNELDKARVKGTLWQKNKHYARLASQSIDNAIKNLETGFNDIIMEPVFDDNGQEVKRIDTLQTNANNIFRILFLYYTRPAELAVKQSLIKAWENFKPSTKYDVQELMKLVKL